MGFVISGFKLPKQSQQLGMNFEYIKEKQLKDECVCCHGFNFGVLCVKEETEG